MTFLETHLISIPLISCGRCFYGGLVASLARTSSKGFVELMVNERVEYSASAIC